MKKIFILILLLLVFIGGCNFLKISKDLNETNTSKQSIVYKETIDKCVNLCKNVGNDIGDLGDGPCLSNNIVDGWVCDMAHYPRVANDNLPGNQCKSYMEGTSKHFVEVDINCNFIRAG